MERKVEFWAHLLEDGSVYYVYKRPTDQMFIERDYLHVVAFGIRNNISNHMVFLPSGDSFTIKTTNGYERTVLEPKFFAMLLNEYIPDPVGTWEEIRLCYFVSKFIGP